MYIESESDRVRVHENERVSAFVQRRGWCVVDVCIECVERRRRGGGEVGACVLGAGYGGCLGGWG